jgi:hypothetical protein
MAGKGAIKKQVGEAQNVRGTSGISGMVGLLIKVCIGNSNRPRNLFQ